jgi:hypothetical protein
MDMAQYFSWVAILKNYWGGLAMVRYANGKKGSDYPNCNQTLLT